MKARTIGELRLAGKTIFAPNRKQGKTHNLCTCSRHKRDHYMNGLGHSFKAGDEKNVVEQKGRDK